MITVTKRFTFEAAHYLEREDLSPAANVDRYHACSGFKTFADVADPTTVAQPVSLPREPHGHSYILEVTVAGNKPDADGFIIDFKKLKALINVNIVDKCDHLLLNKVEMFAGVPTTCENMLERMAPVIGESLVAANPNVWLSRLRLWETADSYAEWTRE